MIVPDPIQSNATHSNILKFASEFIRLVAKVGHPNEHSDFQRYKLSRAKGSTQG